jgi:hypothetical protein
VFGDSIIIKEFNLEVADPIKIEDTPQVHPQARHFSLDRAFDHTVSVDREVR